jgi:hypothetical protein
VRLGRLVIGQPANKRLHPTPSGHIERSVDCAIRDRYALDMSDVDPPTLWAIAERIDETRHGA